MKLTDMKIGDEAIIKKIKADDVIKARLVSMGIAKGNRIKLLDHTLQKQTWEVDVEGTRVALRKEEAQAIEVER
ncbi:ferrous iron transport protein A [Nitratiruptor sp. YY08-26]|uniref:FeoA family protein n=1 Tax=unclassified Nitratiruptor TaxID=2624044 RepID=UPI001915CBEF|nr:MULTISPECIES: FeoA family protein [unclassified Nitratiruptor]BCD62157.1 ferrous iron transport protein A [Nitratiruptor sp. YY08-13]BCD66093.1 ferrous iron transport protein A [Nitratiruptor sp. YY08-26]